MSDNTPTLADYARRMRALVEEDVRIAADLRELAKEMRECGHRPAVIKAIVKALVLAEDYDNPKPLENLKERAQDVAMYGAALGIEIDGFGSNRILVNYSPSPHDSDTGEVLDEAPATTEQHTASTDAAGLTPTSALASGDDPGLSSRAPRTRGAGEGDRPMRAALPNPIPSAPSQGLHGGQPCSPSPDAVPAADDTAHHTAPSNSGQSERAPDPIPLQSHIVPPSRELGVTEDILPHLVRRASA